MLSCNQPINIMDNSLQTHTVLLVEDDVDTRERLAKAVSGHENLELISSVGTVSEGLESLKQYKPTVMLTDLGLPDGSGLDLIKAVSDLSPKTEVMVITIFGDEKHVLSAVESGAHGYLLKDGDDNYIGDSIIDMLNGSSPISPAIARHLLKRFQVPTPEKEEHSDVPKLTPRESEILKYVAKGFSFPEIADLLEMSPHTVTHHIKHIYKKLAVRSRGEAVFEAMQMGLVSLD
jgi:DNA-binding NarL/FixJ family response regulator